MTLNLPEMLNIPVKMFPLLLQFNNFKYFLCEGGRGSAKTQSIARIILFLCGERRVRVFALREVQNSIEDSVYTVFVDLIRQYNLPFNVTKSYIEHAITGSIIKFKGAREQGNVNLKGIEGADIVWLEEAQSISKSTLDILIPTIRKEKAKFFISMNRFLRDDPVYSTLHGRSDCLTITVQYFDNPFCPENLKTEAEECRKISEQDYNHIWLGMPLNTSTDYLFNFEKLDQCFNKEIIGEEHLDQLVIGIDLAGCGGDLCAATFLRRRSLLEWEQQQTITWDGTDTDATVGRIIAMYNQYNPAVLVVDKGGLGYPIFISLSKTIPVIAFDGSMTDKVRERAGNNRAQAYMDLKEWVDKLRLRITSKTVKKQLECIKIEYKAGGKVYIESKQKMKASGRKSPDEADSFNMALYGVNYYLGREKAQSFASKVKVVNKFKRNF